MTEITYGTRLTQSENDQKPAMLLIRNSNSDPFKSFYICTKTARLNKYAVEDWVLHCKTTEKDQLSLILAIIER